MTTPKSSSSSVVSITGLNGRTLVLTRPYYLSLIRDIQTRGGLEVLQRLGLIQMQSTSSDEPKTDAQPSPSPVSDSKPRPNSRRSTTRQTSSTSDTKTTRTATSHR